jgi:tetratricopeptide (TPR) repeat protein
MRLLRLDPSGKLVSTDFHGKTIPPYAILSHRWGEGEVLFEDVENGAYKEKHGFRKIEFCAKRAAEDHLQYFWSDTCCIDKWNTLELSKSINSMYCWYKAAEKCYVYFSDVSVAHTTEILKQSDWEDAFRASVWFKRGWTLQELIAPASVEFFTCEGQRFGDKLSLESLVHEITGIPHNALQNFPMDGFSITERRAWVTKRQTREEEDMVYCLLGLLGASMPINYGEGKESALARLQEQMAANNAPSTLPYLRNSKFVGRESQLTDLESKLFIDKPVTTVAIVGSGGTGKSQLALELAHKTRQENKSCSTFWVNASDMDSLHQGYSNIAQELNLSGWDDDEADIKTLVQHHLTTADSGWWLLVFDGMDDITLEWFGLSGTGDSSSKNYLPQSESGSIVFTTTSFEVAERLASQNTVKLEKLAPELAQRILVNYLRNPALQLEQREAELLLEELSYLPLAIIQAAAFINTTGTTVQEYRHTLLRQNDEALLHGITSSDDALHEKMDKSPVASTLRISVNHIRQSSPLAAEYLFLTTSLDRKDIPDEVFREHSPSGMDEAIQVLSNYALVTRRPADSALDLHRLVHRALQELLVDSEPLQWTFYAMKALHDVFPHPDHGSRSKCRRLLPHARYALSRGFTEDLKELGLYLTWKVTMTLRNEGRSKESAELEVTAVERSKELLGEEHEVTVTAMNNLAVTYTNQGLLKEAAALGLQVLEIKQRVLGEEHQKTLATMVNLANTYRDQGQLDDAAELGEHVLEIEKRLLRLEHPASLSNMNNLALTYRDQGEWGKAEELGLQAIAIQKRVIGAEHPSTLNSMSNLAMTYSNQGRADEALELKLQVLEIRKRVLGEEHPDTLASMNNLATSFYREDRFEEALVLMKTVVEVQKKILSPQDPMTMNSAYGLAMLERKCGPDESTLPLFLERLLVSDAGV